MLLAIIFVDLWLGGPLRRLDVALANRAIALDSPWRGPLLIPDGVGLRAVTAPALVVIAGGLGWRIRSWRPVVVSLAAILLVNLTVGVMKLGFGRGLPRDDNPELFIGGVMWPSGHAANISMTMAMLIFLFSRYRGIILSPRAKAVTLAVPTSIMCSASIICAYHWLTDLIAGVAVGLLVALTVSGLDDRHRLLSASRLPDSWLRSAVEDDAGERSAMV
ncbi:MAG: phosphatase PAP2 family protein [Acidimicrobiales bacterium]